jgi:hypothetical protein
METSMSRFTVLMAVAAVAASLAGFSQPGFAFQVHFHHIPTHPSNPTPSGPFAGAGGAPYSWGR